MKFFVKNCQKTLAKIFQKPIIRRTQRRDVVEIEKYTSRRCFLLFNNQSDNLCGHLLILEKLKRFRTISA
ncbi:hypothetical protein C3007_00010 [Avibacterium gallinarum]|nr:hypothetical protein C3007_00010 [Avibacterium gallinarum]